MISCKYKFFKECGEMDHDWKCKKSFNEAIVLLIKFFKEKKGKRNNPGFLF